MPERAKTCVPALSLMATAPLRVPVAVAEKVTAIVQVPLAATGVEIEQVVLGSSAKSPLGVSAPMFRLLVPLFVRMTDCTTLVVPTTWLPNLKLEGLSETPGAVPVPLRAMTAEPLLALIVIVPVRVPATVGVKVTPTVQVAAGARELEVEQVVVLESSAKSPEAAKPPKLSAAVPELVRVTICAALVVFTTWLPKVRLEDVTETPGAVPVPLSAMTAEPLLALSVTVPVRVPVAVGVKVTPTVQVEVGARELEVEQVVVLGSRA